MTTKKRIRTTHVSERVKILTTLLVISIAIIILFLLFIFLFFPKSTQILELYSPPLLGYERVDISVSLPNTIILTSGCLQLTASTTIEQTESILRALEKKEAFRPNAHDLSKFIFEEFELEVIAVKIEELRDGTYYSKLVLQQGNKVLNLDARPSDAIAIALRVDKPIYIKKALLENVARNIC